MPNGPSVLVLRWRVLDVVRPVPLSLLAIIPVGVHGSNKRFQLLIEPPFQRVQLRNALLRAESVVRDVFSRNDLPDSLALLAWGVPHGIDQERDENLKAP